MTTTHADIQGSLDPEHIRLLERQIEDALIDYEPITDCAVVFHGTAVESVPAERCVRCGMDAAYPGTVLDPDGVCDLCVMYAAHEKGILSYFGEVDEFVRLVRERAEAAGSEYDALLLFSGGKDSTYVLHQLVRLGLKVMTFTFDNGFISKTALDNVETITKALGIEHVTMTRAGQNRIFLKSLQQNKSVCNGCFRSLLDLANQLAHERGIPSIVTGLSRGQIIDERLLWFYRNGEFERERIEHQLEAGRKVYHQVGSSLSDGVLDRVEVIDYYRFSDVTKDDIRAYLTSGESLWSAPKDTGFCSSNCMINDVGVYVHKLERGFHNYESPTRWEVRLGHLSQDEADAELRTPVNIGRVRSMLGKIGYSDPGDRSRLGRRMTAYYVRRGGVSPDDVRDAVAARLPEILLPEYWVEVATVPRTAAGSVDRRALPDPAPASGKRLSGPDGAGAADAPAAGTAPTAAQRLLLAEEGEALDGRARALLLDLPAGTGPDAVKKAVLELLLRHDTLRTPFERHEGGWRRAAAGPIGQVPVARVDVSKYDGVQESKVLRVAAERLRGRLDVGRGPLVQAVLVERGARRAPRLLLVVHELAADLPGWQRLLADLGSALRQLTEGGRVVLSGGQAFPAPVSDETAPAAYEGALWAPPAGVRPGAPAATRRTVLDAERTAALVRGDAPLAAAVAAAVTHALSGASEAPAVLLGVTDHTGELASGLYALAADPQAAAGAAVRQVRTLLTVPVAAPSGAAVVRLGHLGDLDGLFPEDGPLRPADSEDHDLVAPFGPQPHPLAVVSHLRGGRLHLDWTGPAELLDAAGAAASALASIAGTAEEGTA
ncbi:condensation domain-containing protein [Streptomyces sp. NPDC006259]|uniref:condensation domain-containing protein n=1 Tax=Streptomyces sp. NPDC006259 TaxID=3364740 RepID=UPI0036C186AE